MWPAIISEEKHQQILATFQTKKISGRRTPPRRYLLSGLLKCGKCGARLYSSARGETRRDVCLSGSDHGGSGGPIVVASPVEEWPDAAVLLRLATPVMNDALAGRVTADERQTALLADLHAAQSKMVELAEMFAEGEVSRPEWKAARAPLEARVTTAQRQLDQITGTHALDGLVGQGGELAASWSTPNLDRQAQIVPVVLEYATIMPGISSARSIGVNRIVLI